MQLSVCHAKTLRMKDKMPFAKGDFIIIDYVAKVKETGAIFDTTKEDIAKKEHLYKESKLYEPKLIIIGERLEVLPALDESLATFEPEKLNIVEIPPDKAFGPRDPEKVRLISLRRLTEKGITPQLGAEIEYNGQPAIVRTMGAGRVQLDFNRALAGKTLVYEVTVTKKLESIEEKLTALLHRRIPLAEVSKFDIKIKKTEIDITMPEEAFYLEGIQASKSGLALDIQKFFPEINMVKFVEMFKRQKPAAPTTPTEEKIVEEKTAETETPKTEPTETTAEAKNTEVVEEKPAQKE
jgi:peptidylprolyl isomerase